MSKRIKVGFLIGIVLSVSLISSTLAAVLTAKFYGNMQFEVLGTICREIMEQQPEARQTVASVLKEYKNQTLPVSDENMLASMGYRPSDFEIKDHSLLFASTGFLLGMVLFLFAVQYKSRKENLRIQALTAYLEQVNLGKARLPLSTGEDELSKLQDEIYKTVTMLYQMREAAVEAKYHFAENLSNIAHQLKTPITAISLFAQMMKIQPEKEYAEQIQQQISRLAYLEEALLVLSRIDAGTLTLEKNEVDVYTVLTLAADQLQPIAANAQVTADIPEQREMKLMADLDWTMEAIINLMKNCMEHSPSGGTVHCSYEENPLYIEIRIWDEGRGFASEDLPHLFERFYRGQNPKEGGIGIGLALAKEIIERQNGTIRAQNLPEGGGCFEIRFYSH